MVSQAENDLLTQTGPGTPCGELMRRFWLPAALSEELPPGGAPKPIRVLNEDLVLFRDDEGRPGLLGIHCSHRGADLSYGRLEDGGIRCIYHGWLYDRTGRCLEQPGEPAGSTFHERIRHTAYPCLEAGGLILAYMGPGEPPPFPRHEFLTAGDEHVFAAKILYECNYLQGSEGNIDHQHSSFLHRHFLEREPGAAGGWFYTDNDPSPRMDVVEMEFGVRICAVRRAGPTMNHVKYSTWLLPSITAVPSSGDGGNVQWHVPIDDLRHWRYIVMLKRSAPLDKEPIRRRHAEVIAPDYSLFRNKSNRYLQDREEMRTLTFSGLGLDIRPEDTCATEGAGPIQDRTQEHLTHADAAIVASRRVLLRAISDLQQGREPTPIVGVAESGVPTIIAKSHLLPAAADWQEYWEKDPPNHGQPDGAVVGAERVGSANA